MKEEIASARAFFEKAERETDPELKAHALEEALAMLASLDPDEISESERTLIGNLRLAHTRRLLVQLVGLQSASMDAWFEYLRLLFGDLSPEVERLIETTPHCATTTRSSRDCGDASWPRCCARSNATRPDSTRAPAAGISRAPRLE